MESTELCFLSVSEAARLVRQKQVSPVELAQAHLARINELQPKLNAFITVLDDHALTEARRAESEIQGGLYRGLLHGLPAAIKDVLPMKGFRTTHGFGPYRDNVSNYDAGITERFQAAGAYIIGKLNTTALAYDGTGANQFFGDVQNPWKIGHMSGGSSGGSAVAASSGQCSITIGGDTGGSIRIPAGLSGVVGLKPTFGRISGYGSLQCSQSFDHPGPLCRTVEDCAIVMNAVAGYDPRDPNCVDAPVPDYTRSLHGSVKGVRVGVPRELAQGPRSPESDAAVGKAIDLLDAAGAHVSDVSVPLLNRVMEIMMPLQGPEAMSIFGDIEMEHGSLFPPLLQDVFRIGRETPATDYVRAQLERIELRKQCQDAFEEVDVLITPANPMPAPAHGLLEFELSGKTWDITDVLAFYTRPWNVSGHPSMSVPCGFSDDGLPLGMLITGRPFEESTVLQVGHFYQLATDWHQRHPPV
jgi:aspartyl-tRNA(Asn)/glutamyl-tRNA(Gln) amidotransferase subunit A